MLSKPIIKHSAKTFEVGKIFFVCWLLLSLASCTTPTPTPTFTAPTSLSSTAVATTTATTTVVAPTATPPPAGISPRTVAQLAPVATFGKGNAETIAWSPDGQTFAVATSLGIELYAAATFTPTGFLHTAQENHALAFSPDGRWLAVGSRTGSLQIWDVATQRQVHSLTPNTLAPVFSADGKKLAAAEAEAEAVHVWDAVTGELLDTFFGYTRTVEALAFSPDGQLLLAASGNTLTLRDLATRELRYPPMVLNARNARIKAVFFSPDGAQFGAVSDQYLGMDSASLSLRHQSSIHFGLVSTGQVRNTYAAGKDLVYSVALSPDQRWVVTSGWEGIYIWDKTSKITKHILGKPTGALAFSPTRQQVATIKNDGQVHIWDFATQKDLKVLDQYTGLLTDATLSADGQWVALTGSDYYVQVRETTSGQTYYTAEGNFPLALSPDGARAFFAAGTPKEFPMDDYSYNNVVELLELHPAGSTKPRGLGAFPCPSAEAVAFSADGQWVAYGGKECAVRIRDAASGAVLHTLAQAQNYDGRYYVAGLAFSPDGRHLVVMGYYKIEIWDVQTEQLIHTIEDDIDFGTRISFSADGQRLAIGVPNVIGGDAEVKLWDMAGQQVVLTLKTPQSLIKDVAFSPDGQVLAIAGFDAESGSQVVLWDAWSGQRLHALPISTTEIVRLGFSANGQTLMTAGTNGAITLWQAPAAPEPALTPTPRATPTRAPTYTSSPTPLPVQISQVITLGKGLLSPISRSPDGKLIAMLDGETLRWFDATTLKELGAKPMEFSREGARVWFSPNSQLIIVENYFGGSVIDLTTQKAVGGMSAWNGSAVGFTFSPDSRYIAYRDASRTTGGPYHEIGLLDLVGDNDRGDGSFFETLLPGRYHVMSNPAISPDGKLVAAGHSDKRVYVWDLVSGERRFLLEGHAGIVTSVDFSPDGRYLASGSSDGTVRLWQVANGQLLRVITGFSNDVAWVRFIENGRRLRVGVSEQPDQVWEAQTGQLGPGVAPTTTPDPFAVHLHQQGYAESSYNTLTAFSPDGRSLALATGNILVWDVVNRQLNLAIEVPAATTFVGLAYSPEGAHLAALSADGGVWAWEAATGKPVLALSSEMLMAGQAYYAAGGSAGVGIGAGAVSEQSLAFSPDGKRLVFGNGPTIEVWDMQTASKVLTLTQNTPPAYATRLSFSKDGQRIYAVLNRNARAAIWDAASGALLREVALPKVAPNAFTATDLNGPLLARNNYADERYWVELWNLDDATVLRLDTPARETEPLRFSPDGQWLMALVNHELYFWQTQTGQRVYVLTDTARTNGLALSPDNTLLALGDAGLVTLWDTRTLAQFVGQPAVATQPAPTATPKPTTTPTPFPTPALTALPTVQPGAIAPSNVQQVVEVGRFGQGTIEQVVWSPDGATITTLSSHGIYQYAAAALTQTAYYTSPAWAYSLVTLPDGRALAAGVLTDKVLVWELATGKTLAEITGGSQPTLSPDGQLLVYLDSDRELKTWSLASQQVLTPLRHYWSAAYWPIFSPDGKWVAARQDAVRVWDANTGAIVNALGGPANDLADLSFSADSQYLVGAADGSAWVWELRPGTPPFTITLYTGRVEGNLDLYDQRVTAVALSPNNRLLALGDSEKNIWLYDWRNRRLLQQLTGHANAIQHLRFNPAGTRLVSVDDDGGMMLWDVATGQRLSANYEHLGTLNGLTFRTDGNLAVWGGGTAWTLQPTTQGLLNTTHIYSGTILAASPAGDWLAVYRPYRMALWDAHTGAHAQTLEGEAKDPFVEYYWEGEIFRGFHSAAFSPDGKQLVTVGTGGAWLYETQTGRLRQQWPGNNAYGAVFSADGQWLATNLDVQMQTPYVREVLTGKDVFGPTQELGGDYLHYAFSPDKRWFATLSAFWDAPFQLELWDTATHQVFMRLPFSKEVALTSLAFSPDARLLALGQANGQIFLIDTATFKVVATLTGHRGSVKYLAFSADGFRLVSGSDDGTVRFWGLPLARP